MLIQQSRITFGHRISQPLARCFDRIDPDIRFRILKVWSKVSLIVSIRSDIKDNFIRSLHGEFPISIDQCSTFSLRLDTDYIFHSIIIQRSRINQTIITLSHHTTCRYRIRSITEYQVLLARPVGTETHDQHISRIRNKIIPLVRYIVFFKLHYSHSRVQRKNTLVITHTNNIQPCLHIKLSHSRKTTETERLFPAALIRYFTIKILSRQPLRFSLVSFRKCFTYFIKDMR